MTYIDNTSKRLAAQKVRKEHETEDNIRKEKNKKEYALWQKQNPTKGLWDYILTASS